MLQQNGLFRQSTRRKDNFLASILPCKNTVPTRVHLKGNSELTLEFEFSGGSSTVQMIMTADFYWRKFYFQKQTLSPLHGWLDSPLLTEQEFLFELDLLTASTEFELQHSPDECFLTPEDITFLRSYFAAHSFR